MMEEPRELTYSEAICEAFRQLLRSDPNVFAIGQGVWSPWYVGTSMKDLDQEFGRDRVIDTPVSENASTGAAVGAAMAGMRPIVIHPRMDFMLMAMDQISNEAANWCYMTGGRVQVPLTIRAIVNRGGEQAAQHSQALHAWFMHCPGLKVVMPATAYDAKGLLVAAVRDGNPVLYIDDRWLYGECGAVPEEMFEVPIGKAALRRRGSDLTIAAISFMACEAVHAALELEKEGIDAEVLDMRSVKPLDGDLLIDSVRRTGRLIAADVGWEFGGFAAEIVARVACDGGIALKSPPVRIALPNAPAPMSKTLEKAYYPNRQHIVEAARRLLNAPRM